MKYRNYKQLLEQISKDKQIIVGISLWTYHSKRLVFRVSFDTIKKYLDGDMLFKHGDHPVNFNTLDNERRRFTMDKLKIAKVDYIEF